MGDADENGTMTMATTFVELVSVSGDVVLAQIFPTLMFLGFLHNIFWEMRVRNEEEKASSMAVAFVTNLLLFCFPLSVMRCKGEGR